MTVTFEIPLPPEGCKPNPTSKHWAVVQRARDAHAVAVLVMIKKAFPGGVPRFASATVSTAWYCARKPFNDGLYRPTDGDNANASLKAMLDTLVKAGFVPNDTHRYLTLLPPTLLRKKKEHGGRTAIEVTLEGDLA